MKFLLKIAERKAFLLFLRNVRINKGKFNSSAYSALNVKAILVFCSIPSHLTEWQFNKFQVVSKIR